jgi:hypothetical protein
MASSGSGSTGADTGVYNWVYDRMQGLGVSADAIGNIKHVTLNAKDVMDHLLMLHSDLEKQHRFGSEPIRAARDQIVGAMARERLNEIKIELKYSPNDAVQQALIEMMTVAADTAGENQFTPEECALLIQKCIWQVRRKVFDLPVTNHVMLVFVGRQGAGKSEFVAALTGPVREVTTNTDLKAITDDRNIQLFKNFVGVIDELDKADRANVESLKRVITESWMSRRPMRENSMVNVKQNMTFIGTSNRDVVEAIVDETGNRRFVQINIVDDAHPNSPAFWQMVKAFDWEALWRSVDEQGADPAETIRDRVRAVQAVERNKSLIEVWVDHLIADNHPLVTEAGVWVPATTMFTEYTTWEREYAPQWQSSIVTFGKSLRRLARQNLVPFKERRKDAGIGYDTLGVAAAKPVTKAQKMRAGLQSAMSPKLEV